MEEYKRGITRVFIDRNNPSITRDDSLCIMCGACKNTCEEICAVANHYDIGVTKHPICIKCGQCASTCPVNAIKEKNDVNELENKIKSKKYTIVFQTAPAVRTAMNEMYNLPSQNMEKELVQALRLVGANYVFDTAFGADVTVMEEANELVRRLKKRNNLPLFTSCCPAWVEFVDIFLPEYKKNLSTTKSPIMMLGTLIKTYFAKIKKLKSKNIISVALVPCTAKKAEIKRHENYHNGQPIIDYAITIRELKEWLDNKNIDFSSLTGEEYDSLFNQGSHGGYLFGKSGGVMEATLRYVDFLLCKENVNSTIDFSFLKSNDKIKEKTITIGKYQLNVAAINGTANALKLIHRIEQEHLHYDFIEVMACPGGCIAGGGQPKTSIPVSEELKTKRAAILEHHKDKVQVCYQNTNIVHVYKKYLIKPNSSRTKKLLHNKKNVL